MLFRLIASLKIVLAILLTAVLLSCSTAIKTSKVELRQLTPFQPGDRYITAVLPFRFKGEQEQYSNLSDKLVDITVVELFNTRRFRIVERSRIDAILDEIKLSQQGVTQDKMANQVGQQVGAEMVLVGVLSAVKPIMKKDTIGLASVVARGFEVTLQGRLIDVSKGEVVVVGQANGLEINKEHTAMGAKTGSIAAEETLLNNALEKAVKILVNEFAAQINPKSAQRSP